MRDRGTILAGAVVDRQPGHVRTRQVHAAAVHGMDDFNFEDMRSQMRRIAARGGVRRLVQLLPAACRTGPWRSQGPLQQEMARVVGMLDAMTPAERRHPDLLIDGRRRARIARGAGCAGAEVDQLVADFYKIRIILTQLSQALRGRRWCGPAEPSGPHIASI